MYGLASGIGVALADATYGGIAAFGLAALASVLVGARVVLGLIGGAFLLVSRLADDDEPAARSRRDGSRPAGLSPRASRSTASR